MADVDLRIQMLPLPGDCSPLPDLDVNAVRPVKMVVCEVNFDATNDKLKFYYPRIWGPISISDLNDFKLKINKMASSGASDYGLGTDNGSSFDENCDSYLSLCNMHYRYIVFILTKKNWQFAQKGVPIMMQDTALSARVYHEARRVTPGGDMQQIGDGNPQRDGSRIAYFIADGAQVVKDPKNPSHYSHAFNLYVDIVAGKKVTPLAVDPDIRYPGGLTLDQPDNP